jgi:hypothetical protein
MRRAARASKTTGGSGANRCAARLRAARLIFRIISFRRLYVYMKMPRSIRKPLPRGPLRAPEGAFGRLHFLVEIN